MYQISSCSIQGSGWFLQAVSRRVLVQRQADLRFFSHQRSYKSIRRAHSQARILKSGDKFFLIIRVVRVTPRGGFGNRDFPKEQGDQVSIKNKGVEFYPERVFPTTISRIISSPWEVVTKNLKRQGQLQLQASVKSLSHTRSGVVSIAILVVVSIRFCVSRQADLRFFLLPQVRKRNIGKE